MFKQKEIQDLLTSLIIFSAEEKKAILAQYENATEQSAENLVEILTEAKQKQDEYIVNMVKADPEFASRTKAFLHDSIAALRGESEESDKAQLDALERQLEL